MFSSEHTCNILLLALIFIKLTVKHHYSLKCKSTDFSFETLHQPSMHWETNENKTTSTTSSCHLRTSPHLNHYVTTIICNKEKQQRSLSSPIQTIEIPKASRNQPCL